MIRQVLIFVIAAGIGGVLALAVRSAVHQPYAAPAVEQPNGHEHQTPTAPLPEKTPANDPHAGHAAAPAAASANKPVNDICAICGMDVDPELPTATFQGKIIGFACLKCPPKFAKDPEHYGPAYLRNEKLP